MYPSFEDWTGSRVLATLGSNAGSTAIPFQRWRHFKEAFAPEIVHEAIHASRGQVKACIDPFGGSGTTAITCQFLGIRPTTIEVNPYLADLIEAKITSYNSECLVRDLSALMRAANRAGCLKRIEQLPSTFVEPGIDGRWLFDREAAARLLAISLAIDGLATPSHQTLFRVLLGGILVGLSNAVVNGKGRRYRSGWGKRRRGAGDVDLAFTEAAAAAIGEIGRFGRRACSDFALVRGDSRTAIAGLGPFDLAVFSPPYPNSFDYTDVYNIELWMLGYLQGSDGNRALRQSTLASHVQTHRTFAPPPTGSERLDTALHALSAKSGQLWDTRIPAMLGAYFAEILGVFEALRSELRPGGAIWAVVGDSRYAGVAFGAAEIIAELASTRGLEVERVQTLREMRASAQQGGQTQLAESLLVVRRP